MPLSKLSELIEVANDVSVELTFDDETDADFYVCLPSTAPLVLPDNETGECTSCGMRIQFRPDSPSAPKICQDCALAMMQKEKMN